MPVILDNPIINSYVQGLKMRREQEQTEFERTQKKEESGRASEQLKGYLAHLKAEEAHRGAEIDLHRQQVATERAMHELQARKTLGEMINSGGYRPGQGPAPSNVQDTSTVQRQPNVDPGGLPTNLPQMTPGITAQPGIPSQPVQIGDMSINPDDFAGPSAMLQSHLNSLRAAGAVTAQNEGLAAGAKANAELPADLTKLGATGANQLNLANVNTEAQKAIKAQEAEATRLEGIRKDATAMQRVQATTAGQAVVARIGAEARRYAADKAGAVDPAIITNNATLHMTGQGGVALGNSKQDVATKLVMSQMGGVDFSAKDAEKFKSVHGLDPLYDKMKDFVAKMPETQAGAGGQLVMSMIPTTDLNNLKKELKGVSGNIAHTMGGETGRLSDNDVERALGLLTQPGITKKQALDRLSFFEANTRSKVMDQLLGGMNDKQKLLLLHTYEFDPSKFNSTTKYKGRDVMRFKQDPADQEWLVFNPKKGGYEGIDATR